MTNVSNKDQSGRTENKKRTLAERPTHGERNILGGFHSFDADSLSSYSEFDTESVTLDYFRER